MFLQAGFNDYISKPIEIAKLDALIARWIPAEKQIKAGTGIKRESFSGAGGIVIPGVDTRKGIAMTGGTEVGYRKVLAQFYKDAAERLPLLKDMPGEKDLPAFAGQAHALKSAAGTIGAEELPAEAAALEAAGKAGDTETIGKILPGFHKHLTQLIEDMGKFLKESEGPGMESGGLEAGGGGEQKAANVIPRFSLLALKAALEARDMRKIDTLLEEIERLPLDAKDRDAFNVLSDRILLGEYQEARNGIDTILRALS
jgi:HPt (histidine-containing phosphotransfer) domain-containing protein